MEIFLILLILSCIVTVVTGAGKGKPGVDIVMLSFLLSLLVGGILLL